MPAVTLDDVPLADAVNYAGTDADATWQLNPILDQQLDSLGLRHAYDIDIAVVPMLRRMMDVGMMIEPDHFTALDGVFGDMLADLTQQIVQYGDSSMFQSPSSPDQVAWLLFDYLELKYGRFTKSKKRLSTDDKTLEALKYAHPVVPLIQEYREIAKLRGTYCTLPQFADSGNRIHPDLSLTRVPSGRLASSDPNLLAIPVRTELGKEIRRGFVAPNGCVLASADLDQIEMRCMAHISQDENMLEAFTSGVDIHKQTASLMFNCSVDTVTVEQRHHGKQVGFGIVNGITASGYVDQMYLRGAWKFDEREYQSHLGEAQRMIDLYLEVAYPKVRQMFDSTWDEGRRNGYVRDSLSGRIWRLPGLRSSIDKVRFEAQRQATNFKIQTMAQTVIKLGMAMLWDNLFEPRWVPEHLEPLLQVHDELLFEVEADPAESLSHPILELLTFCDALSVPVKAKWHTGSTWADLKD